MGAGVLISEELQRARESGEALRIHARSGEVLVARVLEWDGERLLYRVESSSRPENYAVCDSTGFELRLDEIERVAAVRSGRGRRR